MTPEETGKLLGICASYDQRTVGEMDVIAWFRIIGQLPYGECEAAVIAWYTASRERIMPADIRAAVRRNRSEISNRNHVRELLDPEAYRAQIEKADAAFLRKLSQRIGRPLALKRVGE